MPGIARSRRQPRSCSPSCRSTRPRATSRAARTSVSALHAARSNDWSSAGAVAASTAALGRSRRPLPSPSRATQRRPRAPSTRRWIAAARSYSISCSQIAHASASNGSGRRPTRSHGRAAAPSARSAGRARTRAGTGAGRRPRRARSASARSHTRPPSRVRAHAPNRTTSGAVCATRTSTGCSSWCSSRSSTLAAPARHAVHARCGAAGETRPRASPHGEARPARSAPSPLSVGRRRRGARAGARRASSVRLLTICRSSSPRPRPREPRLASSRPARRPPLRALD